MFNNSKYTKIYFNIIENARSKNRSKTKDNYFESHHIIPSSFGGGDGIENRILLTAKEHYICHLLLPKMCLSKNHYHKAIFALNRMLSISPNQQRVYSRQYENIKKMFAKSISEVLKNRKKPEGFGEQVRKRQTGRTLPKEVKDKIKNNHHDVSGINNPMFGKRHSTKTKEKISEANKGKLSGPKNHMFGKTHSEETKKKISEHGKNKWTPEMKKRMIETRIKNKMKKENNCDLSSWLS